MQRLLGILFIGLSATLFPVAGKAGEVRSTAFEASHVISATGAVQLNRLDVFNSKGTAQFILIMNASSLPADGAVTLLYPPIPIAANQLLTLTFPRSLKASTGIVVCNSSTGTFTKTIGSADIALYAETQ
jgi:hypothetical protein